MICLKKEEKVSRVIKWFVLFNYKSYCYYAFLTSIEGKVDRFSVLSDRTHLDPLFFLFTSDRVYL